ncbi:MAG: hypothetical protein U5L11_12950 [Arhodomonas sp.]|nr:hypothetical protein [Arhodomonas sp.]
MATHVAEDRRGGQPARRPGGHQRGRKPPIVADAAHCGTDARPARECTGNFFIDEQVLRQAGVSDFSRYRVDSSRSEGALQLDLFVRP